ncbi:SLC13 family permease [Ignavibacteria bacterium CHB1]|nr:MAG: SLC13 family permease [Chlorobiota bacterium]MBV6399171.1 hypothetical protein [Ignavibacteria bacterium]MCC6885382.1 SLC13 family permease [Ignavibacteriales bacterium]MCE7953625.1 SLC13 family permease [Chlorobi bacterium CHB7]MDL1887485.1 SLC13 family permease [Ignavibacteria bacterium CHB1]RIK49190.1 MAG: SLC13 family permease [Ignavibacteriota bacterium]
MTFEIAIVITVVIVAVILFATEKISVDIVAILVMCFLVISGILEPLEGLAGFSNEATITVASLFVVSAAMFKTGIVNIIGNKVTGFFRVNFTTGILMTILTVGILSAFINNTPIVAIFIPIMLGVSKKLNISASKLLIPISFASLFGGVCTLIGTSTNILINSIAISHGLTGFRMFEFSFLGVILFIIGSVYLLTIGIKMIPNRRQKQDLSSTFMIRDFITEIRIKEDSKSVDHKISESSLIKDLEVTILEVNRGSQKFMIPKADFVLRANDILKVKGNIEKIKNLKDREGIALRSLEKISDDDFADKDTLLVEAVISQDSDLIGKTLKSSDFRNNYGGIAIAIAHGGRIYYNNLGDIRLRAGDSLLIEMGLNDIENLSNTNDFVVLKEIENQPFRKEKIIPAVVISIGLVLCITTGIIPIVMAAVTGALLLVLTGVITSDEAYKSIDWKVIFLLAGALSMGEALEKSGAAVFISENLINLLGGVSPFVLISTFYLLTAVLTEAMSNSATAILVAPIAIVSANSIGVDPRPLLLAVIFGASSSFMTPIGYQTNLMIYGAGQYKFIDFIKVGAPLKLFFWILASLLIPVIFPF